MAADVGDEQHGSDPTVTKLCERVADTLGKEAAVFLPSGTMCNVAAILVHCAPGEEVIAHETSHILTSEGGAHAAFTGAQILPLQGPRGTFTSETLKKAIRPKSRYAPRQRLLSVEQTANIGGGAVWPLADLQAVTNIAREQGWSTHMDGARLMNAAVAANVPASDYAACVDSVWIDFTKGLGAPLGAALAGSLSFIDEVWRWKQRLGGSMRQAGLCAAGCLHSLDHHVDRLAEDHKNAKQLATALSALPGMVVEEPDTNLVFFDPSGAGLSSVELVSRMREQGVSLSVLGNRVRACTHLDVTAAMVEEAVALIRDELPG